MNNARESVVREAADLNDKIEKAVKALSVMNFMDEERMLLSAQVDVMKAYKGLLIARLAIWREI